MSLIASLLAFFWFNRPPARIYLGDGGSYLLGTALAVLLTTAWAPGVGTATGLIALALVAIPVAELACAIIRRARSRQALTAGDRQHPYDQLVARGWPRMAASGVYIGMELIVVVAVALVPRHSNGVAWRSTPWSGPWCWRRRQPPAACHRPIEARIMSRLYLSPPEVGDDERRALLEAFDSNWIAPVGPDIDAFEREVAERAGVEHAVALSSGTAALHLALVLAGVGPGDEVLVPSFTFIASASPVVHLGATPVFIDCSETSWNLDPHLVEEALSNGPPAGSAGGGGRHGRPLRRDRRLCAPRGPVSTF